MRRFLTFLTLLVVVGCGSSNDFVATNPVNPGAPTTTGSIQVEQTLQRAVTTFVTDIRYTGILPNQSIGYGPETRPKAATTLLESVPTTVTSLRLEYLNGDVVIGRFEIPVEVVAGQVAVLSDPAWLNVLGPDPSFSQGGSVATGTGPTGVAAGDFNNDGRPDVAVANSEDDGVTIHLGDGNGSFGAPTAIATGNIAFNVVVGDLNGDANQDLVVANYGNEMAMETGDISILLGNGDGTFTAAPTLTAENQPIATAIADFNGDGDNDLAISWVRRAIDADAELYMRRIDLGDSGITARPERLVPGLEKPAFWSQTFRRYSLASLPDNHVVVSWVEVGDDSRRATLRFSIFEL